VRRAVVCEGRLVLRVVITGPPGAGKSAVATAVHDLLGDAGVRNALIEADELRRAYPPLPPDQVLKHVTAIAESFHEIGYDVLIVTETTETAQELADLSLAIPGDSTLVVRLDAEPAIVRTRIERREPPTWSGLPSLAAHAERLAVQMRCIPADLVIRTDRGSTQGAASRVLSAIQVRQPPLLP
jgi:hypothetical protein